MRTETTYNDTQKFNHVAAILSNFYIFKIMALGISATCDISLKSSRNERSNAITPDWFSVMYILVTGKYVIKNAIKHV